MVLSLLLKVKKNSLLSEASVTDEALFRNRRALLRSMGFIGAGSLLASSVKAAGLFDLFGADDAEVFDRKPLPSSRWPGSTDETQTAEAKAIGHNNFYEFGLDKGDPQQNAQQFVVDPWTLKVDGEVHRPLTLGYEDLFTRPLEERIYRLRCVEAWSMVIPWIGFPLADLIRDADPKGNARYLAFQTLYDPEQMPGQRNRFFGGGISYPYVEGLRLDEAMHPLTMLVVGVYGKTLPPQNGAPVRLIVPWKYGFKSIKSIVSIRLVEKQPPTTWNISAPNEYGFYANVNPQVDHPRWSQASERRITRGGLGSDERIATQLFNGYADQVQGLYAGMDLRKYY